MTLLKVKNQTPVYSNLMEDFFDREFIEKTIHGIGMHFPKTNILELENSYKIELIVPGFKKEQFKIDVEKNNLLVSAEVETNKEEINKKYTLKQFKAQSFKRSFNLPENVDHEKIDAAYNDGVLVITIEKSAQNSFQVKNISVN